VALIALTSASGSPGVTTTALGLALAWPRPVVLVDADPTGGRSIPGGYFRGTLNVQASIVDLAIAQHRGELATTLSQSLVQVPGSKVQLLCGPLRHNQARSLSSLWKPLATILRDLERNGQDVIVDAGRLGLEGMPFDLLTEADLTLLVTRSHLPALLGASSWVPDLLASFVQMGQFSRLQALLIGPGRPYKAAEAQKVVEMPVLGDIAWDPDNAEVYSLGEAPSRRFKSSALQRSLNATVEAILATLARTRAELARTSIDRSVR